jgi:hypothetical protein
VDSIDVSAVSTSFLGHAYFRDSGSVMMDMFQLMNADTVPDQRTCLKSQLVTIGKYWVFLNPCPQLDPTGRDRNNSP